MFALVQNGEVTRLKVRTSLVAEGEWKDVSHLVDTTELPHPGWSYDGEKFIAPVSPPVDKGTLLVQLEKLKQDYLDKRYPFKTIIWFLGHERNPDIPQSHRDAIKRAWNFIHGQVVVNFLNVGKQIKSGEITSLDAVNFSALDNLDPHITVVGVMELS